MCFESGRHRPAGNWAISWSLCQPEGERVTGNIVIGPTGIGNQYDPLLGKQTEDALLSAATHFTQRVIVMLTQLFLAAREEGIPPLLYVRHMIRAGLPQAAERLHLINPEVPD